jgi:hypothetical protein
MLTPALAAPTSSEARAHSVRLAETLEERRAIARLRYSLYISRDGKAYTGVDHKLCTFWESVDDVSQNFFVSVDGCCLTAVRVTPAELAPRDFHLNLLLEHAGNIRTDVSIVNSRLVVQRNLRARSWIVPLFLEVFRDGVASGARYCIVGTRDDLVPIFLRFGFKCIGDRYVDPVAGTLNAMCLDAHDIEHLLKINSPYVRAFPNAIIGKEAK